MKLRSIWGALGLHEWNSCLFRLGLALERSPLTAVVVFWCRRVPRPRLRAAWGWHTVGRRSCRKLPFGPVVTAQGREVPRLRRIRSYRSDPASLGMTELEWCRRKRWQNRDSFLSRG